MPRKGGPGITQSDVLAIGRAKRERERGASKRRGELGQTVRVPTQVINKTDLAEAVGADLDVMDRDARKMRGDGPTVFAAVKHGKGVHEIAKECLHAWAKATGGEVPAPWL